MPDWLTHSHLFFSSNQNRSFFSTHPIDACRRVAKLHPRVPLPRFHMLPQQSPRGATEVQCEGSIAATLFWNHTPIPFPTLLQSYLCIRILQYPHTLHLQVTQLSANDICCFWHQSLHSKAAQQQWEGKTDIVVNWWPSFLHFRWSASTLKFPILHIKKYLPRTPAALADRLQAALLQQREKIWCSFKQLSRLQTISISAIQRVKLLQKHYKYSRWMLVVFFCTVMVTESYIFTSKQSVWR